MIQKKALAVVVALASLLAGCVEGPGAIDNEAVPVARMSPSVGGLGMSLTIEFRGVNTQWEPGQLTLEMGEAILIAGVDVAGPNFATADIQISQQAALGFRDVSLSFPKSDGDTAVVRFQGDAGFLVEPGGIAISPDRARLGETLTIAVEGFGTLFQEGSTWADFGEGIFVNYVDVLDETHALVSASVDQYAQPGLHDVVVFNGPNGYTLMDGFFVDRSAVAIEIDPDHANQGELMYFTINGYNTHFEASDPLQPGNRRATLVDVGNSICINEWWPDCQDNIRPGGEVQVNSALNLTGQLQVSNGAIPGFYDVRTYVIEEQDFNQDGVVDPDEYIILEEVILHDGFEVREVPFDCNDNPGVGFGLNISRDFNNDTCEVSESVSASVTFYTPLDPPCGNPPQMPPPPFDVSGILRPPPGADCPSARTCDAGEFVYLESELNTIVLERYTNSFTGAITYVPQSPLSLDDYKFGSVAYDLRAEGSEEESQIPAFLAEDVLFTLPSDFELLAPRLCENFTHDPNEDLLLEWTPAQTYDVAGLSAVYATADEQGNAVQLITFPWDDGEFAWGPDWWSQVPEGSGYLIFGAGVTEPKWFLDFGNGPVGLENQGGSGLSYRGYMVLRSNEEAP